MRYDDQLCDSSSDRQCGQLVAPPALYIGSLGTRQAPGTITFPASGQSVSSRQGVLLSYPYSLGLCQPDIDICTQIRMHRPRSPRSHPPLICEEMLHLCIYENKSKHGVFNKIYWGHKSTL